MMKMFNKLEAWLKRLRERDGVTLIELLAVVVILAIIAAIAVPVVLGQINTAKTKTDKANAGIIADAIQRANFDDEASGSSLSIKSKLPAPVSGVTTSQGSLDSVLVPNYLSSIPSAQSATQFDIEAGPDSNGAQFTLGGTTYSVYAGN